MAQMSAPPRNKESMYNPVIERVRLAIKNSKELIGEYFLKTLRSRCMTDDRAGSYFILTDARAVEEMLGNAFWEEYNHPAIVAPAVGFKAPIPGYIGMVPLSDLPADMNVWLLDIKGGEADWDSDRQRVDVCVTEEFCEENGIQPMCVSHTVLLIGPHDADPTKEVVWTVHPGDPLPPPCIHRIRRDMADWNGNTVEMDMHKQDMSIKWAIKQGATHAKIVKSI